jgi:adenosylcobinamide-phosphate synthase
MDIVIILFLAVILDITIGDPPNGLHPVAWLGKIISLEMKLAPIENKVVQIIYGVIVVLFSSIIITTSVYFLITYLQSFNTVVYFLTSTLLLKCTFSIKGLIIAAQTVKNYISTNKLSEARHSLTSLVSRETTHLDKEQVIAATIESVAENSCDSIVAPLFYFAIFGLSGAIAYRIINTFDSMIGYHGRWEYIGKFAAKFDDMLNYVPARITALLLIVSSWICKNRPDAALSIMLRDHKKTESPNAGWTMSAIAGALDVKLEKAGHYQLGDDGHILTIDTINSSLRIMITISIIWSLVILLIRGIYSAAVQ